VLRVASLLHDMGKIDDALYDIVHSTGKLDPEERARIRKHPTESAHILEPLDPFHPGLSLIVRSHHERWDGSGYPAGLRGEQIPLEARLISVADVFDALTQPRGYKDARTVEQAVEEIREGAGTLFDPAVVAVLDRPEVLRRWTRIAHSGRKEEREEAAAGNA
jgi:HD-GYP domain-containing protein (c-di-GMP phosphodiesterase class II)